MEPNNFEKDIQRKLDELKIGPPDSVWTNVEKQIREKGGKRKYGFLFFFLFLMLASGGFWWYNSIIDNQAKSKSIAVVSEKSSKPTNKADSSFQNNGIENNLSSKSDSTKIMNEKSNIQNFRNKQNESGTKSKIHSVEIKIKDSKPTNKQENYFESDKSNPGKDLAENITSHIKKENIDTLKEKGNIQKENREDDLPGKSQSQKIKKETASVNDSIIKKSPKKAQKHPWNFGVTFSGGSSFTTKTHSAGNLIYSNPSGNINSSGGSGYYYTPSELKNSTAFIAGVFAERNISDENKISIGISYQYFSLVNKVGNQIIPSYSNTQYLNSSNNLYNGSNANHSYHNQFHFFGNSIINLFQDK